MMMKMIRVALALGLVLVSSTAAQAAGTVDPTEKASGPHVYVMNNHLVDVRVFAEDSHGKLHRLGRVARGHFEAFEVSPDVAEAEFRIKVFPSSPAWSQVPDDFGIKTSALDAHDVEGVTMWLEADLTRSMVEIARGT